MGRRYDVRCTDTGYTCRVRWDEDGKTFAFSITGPRGVTNLPRGGLNSELPLLADLIEATEGYIDWQREGNVRDALVADQLAPYPPSVRRLVLAR